MAADPIHLLETWLRRQLPPSASQWLDGQLAKLSGDAGRTELDKTLGLMPRRLGRQDLDLSEEDLQQARDAREGWDPRGWTVDEAGRVLAVCRVARDADGFSHLFTELCRSAEVGEAIALYRGLPLYPWPERLEAQAGEGLRTNMRAIFEAIAHRNPFPRERFDQDRWNHMVLKALFIGSDLHPIQGLDERANPVLAQILSDYAHERWAAERAVSLELWRCVGPFAEGALLEDLGRIAASGDMRERQAAALALIVSPAPEAQALLDTLPDIADEVRTGRLTWKQVSAAAA